MLKSLLLPQGEKKNRILPFPRPPKPCLQSCHPVADRLSGVAARRGRRFGGRKDVRRHPEGPRGNWSPSGDTGETAGLSDRSCRLHPNRAPDVPVRHARRRASIAWRLRVFPGSHDAGGGDQPVHNPRLRREIEVAGTNRRTGRRKVSYKLFQTRQLPAPRPTSP